jgi:hypothetical protein
VTDFADLAADLNALIAPGGAHGTTIKGTQRPTSSGAAGVESTTPAGWGAGVKFGDDGSMMVTTAPQVGDVRQDEGAWHGLVESLGLSIPPGFIVRLVEAKYDPAAWVRNEAFSEWPDADERAEKGQSRWTKTPATREAVWRYRFAVERSGAQMHVEDVAAIIAEAMRRKRKPRERPENIERTLNVVYADPQAGKVALLGGTKQLAGRIATSFELLDDHLADLKLLGRAPTSATWWDGGDCIEGFNNVKAQAQTNDLWITQQVRAHRRFTFHGLDWLAQRFNAVDALTAGSNHPQVRDGKDPVSVPEDDWGIDILASVQDGFSYNPDAYGHVRFGYPHQLRDSLCHISGGLPIGLAHGHQFKGSNDSAVRRWWADQTFGEQPTADARVLISGHFHHFAAREMGAGRLWVQAPTLDNGSDWFTRIAGEVSVPGLLVFTSTPYGWDDLKILRSHDLEAA